MTFTTFAEYKAHWDKLIRASRDGFFIADDGTLHRTEHTYTQEDKIREELANDRRAY